jgi:hypothetical protein
MSAAAKICWRAATPATPATPEDADLDALLTEHSTGARWLRPSRRRPPAIAHVAQRRSGRERKAAPPSGFVSGARLTVLPGNKRRRLQQPSRRPTPSRPCWRTAGAKSRFVDSAASGIPHTSRDRVPQSSVARLGLVVLRRNLRVVVLSRGAARGTGPWFSSSRRPPHSIAQFAARRPQRSPASGDGRNTQMAKIGVNYLFNWAAPAPRSAPGTDRRHCH